MTKVLKDPIEIKQLAENLQNYKCVSKFDYDDDSEAWRLANSLSDLEQSFNEILESRLPALLKADNEKMVHDALIDLGEELRHILYHIKDPNFFNYLFENEGEKKRKKRD